VTTWWLLMWRPSDYSKWRQKMNKIESWVSCWQPTELWRLPWWRMWFRERGENPFFKIRLGPGSYPTARSALAFLYIECGVSRDVSSNTKYLWRQLPIYQKGCARTSATEREALGLRTLERKDPIPFAAYEHLARILFLSKDPEYIAVHLCWTSGSHFIPE
jgi:hypothetical protein